VRFLKNSSEFGALKSSLYFGPLKKIGRFESLSPPSQKVVKCDDFLKMVVIGGMLVLE
jgi:hypothetical protein